MLFKFALRNVFRNRKRSILTAISILVASIIVVFMFGLIHGMLDMYVDNSVKYQTGHVRITTENFINREKFIPVDELVYGSDELIDSIRKQQGVERVEERIKFGIMLGNGDKTAFAFGMGIDLVNNFMKIEEHLLDKTVTKLEESGIYIGHKLAAKLGVKEGDDLLLATQTSEGGLNGIKLAVKGLFRFNIGVYDDKFFYVSLNDAKKLLKMEDSTTEIFVFGKNNAEAANLRDQIKKLLPEGVVAKDFAEQMGEMYYFLTIGKAIYYFIGAFVVFLASFVVINTMMMAIFERIREIGTLKALGMTDGDIFLNFILEGAILGAFGATVGGIIGYIITFVTNVVGMDFQSSLEGMDLPFDYIIRPSVGIEILILTIAIGILIPAIATMIPAKYAKRLMPAEALRKI